MLPFVCISSLFSFVLHFVGVVPGLVYLTPNIGMRLAVKEVSEQFLVASVLIGLRIIVERAIVDLSVWGHTELVPAILPSTVLHLLVALCKGGKDFLRLISRCDITTGFGLINGVEGVVVILIDVELYEKRGVPALLLYVGVNEVEITLTVCLIVLPDPA